MKKIVAFGSQLEESYKDVIEKLSPEWKKEFLGMLRDHRNALDYNDETSTIVMVVGIEPFARFIRAGYQDSDYEKIEQHQLDLLIESGLSIDEFLHKFGNSHFYVDSKTVLKYSKNKDALLYFTRQGDHFLQTLEFLDENELFPDWATGSAYGDFIDCVHRLGLDTLKNYNGFHNQIKCLSQSDFDVLLSYHKKYTYHRCANYPLLLTIYKIVKDFNTFVINSGGEIVDLSWKLDNVQWFVDVNNGVRSVYPCCELLKYRDEIIVDDRKVFFFYKNTLTYSSTYTSYLSLPQLDNDKTIEEQVDTARGDVLVEIRNDQDLFNVLCGLLEMNRNKDWELWFKYRNPAFLMNFYTAGMSFSQVYRRYKKLCKK